MKTNKHQYPTAQGLLTIAELAIGEAALRSGDSIPEEIKSLLLSFSMVIRTIPGIHTPKRLSDCPDFVHETTCKFLGKAKEVKKND